MPDERWVVADQYDDGLMLAPHVPGFASRFWTRNHRRAIQYVSRDVALCAARILLPLRATVIRRVA